LVPIIPPKIIAARGHLSQRIVPFGFAHRYRFTGQKGFVGEKIDGAQHGGIGGYSVTFLQDKDIIGHHLPAWNSLFLTIANNQSSGAGEILQGVEGLLGLFLLIQLNSHNDKDKAKQHQSFMHIPEKQIKGTAGNKQQKHRFLGDPQGNEKEIFRLRRRQLIVAILLNLFMHLCLNETLGSSS